MTTLINHREREQIADAVRDAAAKAEGARGLVMRIRGSEHYCDKAAHRFLRDLREVPQQSATPTHTGSGDRARRDAGGAKIPGDCLSGSRL